MLNITLVIVCHCRGVSDRRIRREARRGAASPSEVAGACGAGTDCGGCVPVIEDLLVDASYGGAVATPGVTRVQLAS